MKSNLVVKHSATPMDLTHLVHILYFIMINSIFYKTVEKEVQRSQILGTTVLDSGSLTSYPTFKKLPVQRGTNTRGQVWCRIIYLENCSPRDMMQNSVLPFWLFQTLVPKHQRSVNRCHLLLVHLIKLGSSLGVRTYALPATEHDPFSVSRETLL
jgi:hypothetical protein